MSQGSMQRSSGSHSFHARQEALVARRSWWASRTKPPDEADWKEFTGVCSAGVRTSACTSAVLLAHFLIGQLTAEQALVSSVYLMH